MGEVQVQPQVLGSEGGEDALLTGLPGGKTVCPLPEGINRETTSVTFDVGALSGYRSSCLRTSLAFFNPETPCRKSFRLRSALNPSRFSSSFKIVARLMIPMTGGGCCWGSSGGATGLGRV